MRQCHLYTLLFGGRSNKNEMDSLVANNTRELIDLPLDFYHWMCWCQNLSSAGMNNLQLDPLDPSYDKLVLTVNVKRTSINLWMCSYPFV